VEEVFVGEGLLWHLHAGQQVIRTTAEHRFFVRGVGWTPCNQLKVGDWLVTLDGMCVQVEDLLDTGEWVKLYNVRVADHHTYFVGCDEWGFSVWAHNACVILRRYKSAVQPVLRHWSIEIRTDNDKRQHSHQDNDPDGAPSLRAPIAKWIAWTPDAWVQIVPSGALPVSEFGEVDGEKEFKDIDNTKAAAAKVEIGKRNGRKDTYNLLSASCVTYVAEILRMVGVPGVPAQNPTDEASLRAFVDALDKIVGKP
jgi:intein/homing endonuclease